MIKNPVSLSCCLRELYGVKNRKVVFCLNDLITHTEVPITDLEIQRIENEKLTADDNGQA